MILLVKKGVWMFSHDSSNHPNATPVNWKRRMSCALPLFPDDSTRSSGMRMLWKVKGQHQRFSAGVFDLHTTIRQCGLSDETNLRVDLSEQHILVIPYIKLTDAAASAIRMEQCGTFRAELRLSAWLHCEPQN
jgi:hypothetical protein